MSRLDLVKKSVDVLKLK